MLVILHTPPTVSWGLITSGITWHLLWQRWCNDPLTIVVIDEVDSVLIDEARTPLIISGQVERPTEKYLEASNVAKQLVKQEEEEDSGHYEVDEKARNVLLTDEGFEKAEELLNVKDLYDPDNPWAHYVFQCYQGQGTVYQGR